MAPFEHRPMSQRHSQVCRFNVLSRHAAPTRAGVVPRHKSLDSVTDVSLRIARCERTVRR